MRLDHCGRIAEQSIITRGCAGCAERAGGVRDRLDSTAKRGGILGSFKRCAELLACTRRLSDHKSWKALFDEVVHEKLHGVRLAVQPAPAAARGASHPQEHRTGLATVGGDGSNGAQRNPAQTLHENSSVLRNLLQPQADSQPQAAARIDVLGGLAGSGRSGVGATKTPPSTAAEEEAVGRPAAITMAMGPCAIKSEAASAAAAVVNAMNEALPLQSTLSDPRQKADQSFHADLLQAVGLEGSHSKPLPADEMLRGLIDL